MHFPYQLGKYNGKTTGPGSSETFAPFWATLISAWGYKSEGKCDTNSRLNGNRERGNTSSATWA